ncbi:hypothetical protein ABT247_33075 [Kitasatospora sp. NPDC001539]|uniref:hypothetical protein n=1 Tax=Kitasatospora sp. NPDC001539 TaxID=3154384 RepID=UPI00331BCBBA
MAMTASSNLDNSRTGEAFTTVKKCLVLFGVIGVVVLGTVAATAFAGQQTTPFMWIRAVIFPALAPLFLRMTARAEAGSYEAFGRLRTISTVMPIAVIGVDLIPGICPPWYAALQGLSALAVLPVAFLTRSGALKAAFPKR